MTKEKLAYSVSELQKLGVGSKTHIYSQMKKGLIPFIQIGERKQIPKWWVNKFLHDPSVQNLEVPSSEDEVLNRASQSRWGQAYYLWCIQDISFYVPVHLSEWYLLSKPNHTGFSKRRDATSHSQTSKTVKEVRLCH